MEIWKYICVFLFFLKQIHGLRFQSVDGALPQDTQEFSIECSGESGSGVDFFKETSNLGTCLPTPFCSVNAGYDYSIDGSNYTFKITTVSSSSCGAYKCKDIGNLQEDIYELTYNKFSSANTTLSPLEPTAGESGALNITTACLFPASDESLTIKWYKTYQDGKADEALDSSFEIYNETQRSTCTETCSTDTDAKMLIGCRYTPPSNRGTGFQIKVEVMHKAYTDKLYWTFDGTYYDEVTTTTTPHPENTTCNSTVCDCKVLKIVWSVLFIVFSTGSGAWILYVLFAVPKARKWLTEKLCAPTHLCMIGWISVSFLYSISAVIAYNLLVCKDESSEADCWPVYLIIGIVVKGGDVAVSLLALLAFLNG